MRISLAASRASDPITLSLSTGFPTSSTAGAAKTMTFSAGKCMYNACNAVAITDCSYCKAWSWAKNTSFSFFANLDRMQSHLFSVSCYFWITVTGTRPVVRVGFRFLHCNELARLLRWIVQWSKLFALFCTRDNHIVRSNSNTLSKTRIVNVL